MAQSKENTAAVLNNLVQTCLDGEEGFKNAADSVQEAHLRMLFCEFSQQRAQLAAELQQEIHRLGEMPETSGSVGGSLHRGWMNLKAAVTGHDDHAILAECERGEDVAVNAYEKALEEDLPADVRVVINRQYLAVKASHDRVRDMEKAHEHVS